VFTETLYQWRVPVCPVDIFLEIPLADRFRTVAMASDIEIGGFLVGHFENNRTVVTDFELVESEHRRGTAYSLSRRDDQHLTSKLEARRKRKQVVVGFFRSHMRPGMFLDAADGSTLHAHFSGPEQVALLVKPAGDGTASGGFFFWLDGEMDRRETCLAFPMDSHELGMGLAFDSAQTLDELPRMQLHAPVAGVPSPKPKGSTNWIRIGLVASLAAMGGYYFGTSGNHEHFGSRPGDITISDVTEPPPTAPLPPAPPQPVEQLNAQPVGQPAVQPVVQPVVPLETPPTPASVAPPVKTAPSKARASQPASMARNTPTPAVASPPQPAEPAPTRDTAPEPRPNPNAGAFPHNPNPLPPPSEAIRTADATVDLEAPQDGGIKHVIHRIPVFGALGGGYRGGQDFHPPQVLRRITPHVPADIARELTAEVPVDLKLKVDNTGRVSSVELLSHGSDRALVQLAGDAAYEWQFQPAQLKDRPVSSEVIAHFHFRPTAFE